MGAESGDVRDSDRGAPVQIGRRNPLGIAAVALGAAAALLSFAVAYLRYQMAVEGVVAAGPFSTPGARLAWTLVLQFALGGGAIVTGGIALALRDRARAWAGIGLGLGIAVTLMVVSVVVYARLTSGLANG